MSKERGNLSISSDNIFPIIKKWLYSDHDIFIRELISNANDAITKLKKLDVMGEVDIPDGYKFKITVTVNPEEKTIKFSDNGIGMTYDEVKKYINEIAFSGAKQFLEKYKDKTSEDQIIGHFGLGFYSAFMVADRVTIESLSYEQDATPVHWESEGGIEFEMSQGTRTEWGTDITLFLNEKSYEFSNEYRVREVIKKYCSFMPVEIYFVNANEPVEESKEEELVDATVDEEGKATDDKQPKPLNNINPLWTKHPNECTEEEYKTFYREVFHDYKEPLFWIHLNMDYPFNLKGILYFPRINTQYDSLEGVIKLYNNQVFVADNIKEVIPEYLMLLKGLIDCPEFPLNVSRSALQNDGFVKKISDYISKKVADKLSGMYNVERENYEKYWDELNPFIKFGALKDDKFRKRMEDRIIYKNLDGKYLTLDEYIESMYGKPEESEDKDVKAEDSDSDSSDKDEEIEKSIIYYVTDETQQSQYINMFKEEGLDALILNHNIDQPFINQMEYQKQDIKFQRIDADITDSFKDEVEDKDKKGLKKSSDAMTKLFRKVLDKDKLEVKVEKLKNDKISSMITLSEDSRRMQDMMNMYSMGGMDAMDLSGDGELLVLNNNNKLVQYIIENQKSENTSIICEQLYDLAMLSHRPLEPDAMTKFIQRSNEIMQKLAK